MSTVHQTAIAERIASDMRKLLLIHPRAIDVLYAKSIFPSTSSNDENVGNLDYLDSAIDWEPVTTIKMLEASSEVTAKFLADFSELTMADADNPLVVSLSIEAQEQSVITVVEKSNDKIIETSYMVFSRQSIGRNAAGGVLYSLIPFRGQDDEIETSIEEKITETETAEGITPDPVVPSSKETW